MPGPITLQKMEYRLKYNDTMTIKFIQLESSNIKEISEYIPGCACRATPISYEIEVAIDVQITV